MTTIQELEKERNLLSRTRWELDQEQNVTLAKAIADFFSGIKDVEIEASGNYAYFKRRNEDAEYNKELFSIEFKGKYWGECDKYTGVGISYYTTMTSPTDLWELERLIDLGEAARVLRFFQEPLTKRANAVCAYYKDTIKDIYNKIGQLDKEIRLLKEGIKRDEEASLLKKAEEEGITFDIEDKETLKYPYLQTSFKHGLSRVIALKILSYTISGKTAEVEVTCLYYNWVDGKGSVLTPHTSKVKISMKYVDNFLRSYSKQIAPSSSQEQIEV